MSYLGTVRTGIPPLVKLVGAGCLTLALCVALYVVWPVRGPDPAVERLEQQNADLVKQNAALQKDAAALKVQADQATSTGAKLLDQVDKIESDIAELRGRRQTARKAGVIRAATIESLSDEQLHDAVLAHLAAAEAAQKVQP